MAHRHLRAAAAALVVALLGVVAPTPALADGPTGSISGTISVPAGVDVTRVGVYARSSTGAQAGPASVAADGRYTISSVPSGDYYVEFQAWDQGLALQTWPDANLLEDARRLSVGGGPVTGVDAHLIVGGSMSGTIHTNSDCDLSKVTVSAAASGLTLPTPTVSTDGTWSVRGLSPSSKYMVIFDGRYAGLDGYTTWPSPGTKPSADWYVSVTSGSTRTGIDVTLNGPTRGCVAPRPFVTQLYRDLLGREGSFFEVNGWVQDLVWRTDKESVANAITSSDEFRLGMIEDAYDWYLERRSDAEGRSFWLAKMRSGWRIEDIEAGFIASDEYYASFGSTPAGWVRGLYQNVLLREPDAWEVQWWATRLAGGASRAEVARGFLYSTESLSSVVDSYYEVLLRRSLDPTGKEMWVGRIQAGHRDEEIIAGIVTSPEYVSRIPR